MLPPRAFDSPPGIVSKPIKMHFVRVAYLCRRLQYSLSSHRPVVCFSVYANADTKSGSPVVTHAHILKCFPLLLFDRWFATCGATPQVGGEGGCFVTEDQGSSWRRVFDGGPGQQQSTGFALGQGYAIGLALNPFKKGELIVTAGDRPPGLLLFLFFFMLSSKLLLLAGMVTSSVSMSTPVLATCKKQTKCSQCRKNTIHQVPTACRLYVDDITIYSVACCLSNAWIACHTM